MTEALNFDGNDLTEQVGLEPQNEREVRIEGDYSLDKLGRKHFSRFMAGPSLLVLRSSKFECSSSQTHANDIIEMLCGQVEEKKGVAFIKVDNGSDWNLHSLVNELSFVCGVIVNWIYLVSLATQQSTRPTIILSTYGV